MGHSLNRLRRTYYLGGGFDKKIPPQNMSHGYLVFRYSLELEKSIFANCSFHRVAQRYADWPAGLDAKTINNRFKSVAQIRDIPWAWLADNVFNFAQQPHQRGNHMSCL